MKTYPVGKAITHYQIGPTSVQVRFQNGSEYTYSHASAGKKAVEQMKGLARSGMGLASFISAQRPSHASKK